MTRRARLLAALRAAGLYALAAVPWLLGLLAGLIVSLALWLLVATLDGYRTGRGD